MLAEMAMVNMRRICGPLPHHSVGSRVVCRTKVVYTKWWRWEVKARRYVQLSIAQVGL